MAWCEDGKDACSETETDCCEVPRASCHTSTQYDTDGTVLVTACNPGYGCQKGKR